MMEGVVVSGVCCNFVLIIIKIVKKGYFFSFFYQKFVEYIYYETRNKLFRIF